MKKTGTSVWKGDNIVKNNHENKSNFGKFLLLWAGELISAIGGGLTSFGLGVYVFAYGLSGVLADAVGAGLGTGVGRGAALVIQISGILLAAVAIVMARIRSIRELEKGAIEKKDS